MYRPPRTSALKRFRILEHLQSLWERLPIYGKQATQAKKSREAFFFCYRDDVNPWGDEFLRW